MLIIQDNACRQPSRGFAPRAAVSPPANARRGAIGFMSTCTDVKSGKKQQIKSYDAGDDDDDVDGDGDGDDDDAGDGDGDGGDDDDLLNHNTPQDFATITTCNWFQA